MNIKKSSSVKYYGTSQKKSSSSRSIRSSARSNYNRGFGGGFGGGVSRGKSRGTGAKATLSSAAKKSIPKKGKKK